MKIKFPKRAIKGDFVVIDSTFPQEEPLGFRNAEINEYLRRVENAEAYAMSPMNPWGDAWFPWSYGVESDIYDKNKQGYAKHYPNYLEKIHYINPDRRYKFKLAYSYFLAETYALLPFYENNHTPFVFMLYPGGAFGINNDASDKMLRRIFSSSCFRGVIVSQKITKDYLLKKEMCPEDKITYIYGGFVQYSMSDIKPRVYYGKEKTTLDICFVAAKYSEKGVDKGYDVFIETARKLCELTEDVFFHVVGGFDESDIDISDIQDRFTFYGFLKPKELLDFYTSMDIFLAPNKPFELYEGNFDGFPLGIDAGYYGVALLVADELGMNNHYTDGKDICIIPLNVSSITEKIMYYHSNSDALHELSVRCKEKTQILFDTNYQINERLRLFDKFTHIELNVINKGKI